MVKIINALFFWIFFMPEIKQVLLFSWLSSEWKYLKQWLKKNTCACLTLILRLNWCIFFSRFGQINLFVYNGTPFLDWATLLYLHDYMVGKKWRIMVGLVMFVVDYPITHADGTHFHCKHILNMRQIIWFVHYLVPILFSTLKIFTYIKHSIFIALYHSWTLVAEDYQGTKKEVKLNFQVSSWKLWGKWGNTKIMRWKLGLIPECADNSIALYFHSALGLN